MTEVIARRYGILPELVGGLDADWYLRHISILQSQQDSDEQ